jgi:ubiquinone/menaquinone biosynthesis C-methylase UbiE
MTDGERASKSYFDRWARSYDQGRISAWFQYTQNLTIQTLDLQSDSKVLDVGCGTGHATMKLASLLPAGAACGVDISPTMIQQAREKIPEELRQRVEFREANSADLPFEDESFTHIICTNSFHHYPDPLRSLREMKRVLVPQGQLSIFENAPDLSWYTWAWDRALRIIEKGHVRYYSSTELGQMIDAAGFRKVELRHLRKEFLKHGKLFASIQLWTAYKSIGDSARTSRDA